MRFRARVESALENSGLTFTQWLVLSVAHELIRTTDDAVNQNDIAVHAALDRRTISRIMIGLEELGLVDRAPDMTNVCLRVWLTDEAEVLLARLPIAS